MDVPVTFEARTGTKTQRAQVRDDDNSLRCVSRSRESDMRTEIFEAKAARLLPQLDKLFGLGHTTATPTGDLKCQVLHERKNSEKLFLHYRRSIKTRHR